MSAPTTVAVVPLRGPRGKTRLAAELGPLAREELVATLARHVVDVVTAVVGIARVVVVTTDPEHVALVLGDRDVEVLTQPGEARGLDAAVGFARQRVRSLGAERTLVVHADLPLLGPGDVQALIAPTAPVVLAPDALGTGSNALVLDEDRARAFTTRFGPRSRSRHEEEARRLGLDVHVVERPGTACDLDTAADWAALPSSLRAALAGPTGSVPDQAMR